MNRSIMAATAAGAALMLTACSDGGAPTGDDVADMETATTDGEAALAAKALDAGDFMDLQLGARIVGPQGPEVTDAMSNEAGNFGDIRSFVACPAGMKPCDPANAPAGTIFTYVHIVYPGEDNDPNTGVGAGNTSSDIETASAFRMIGAAHGFTGQAGFAKAEAVAAIGAKADVVVSCDAGKLVWTVNAGEGGDQWEQGEPITFYWQSTLPPAGPAKMYALDANYTEAIGNGPYPAAKDGATNACS